MLSACDNYLMSKRWDEFDGALLAEHKIWAGGGGGGGARRAGDNKEIKIITEEAQTD